MHLTQREKQFAIGGIVFLGVFVAFQVFVRPALSRVGTLKRVVAEKREVLSQLRAKSDKYTVMRDKLKQIRLAVQQQQTDGQMLSFIERVQRDSGLIRNVVYMTPTTTAIGDTYERTSVEVKFGAITLEQIVQFLLKIESSKLNVGIRAVDIKRTVQNPALLDAVIQVACVTTVEHD